MPTREQVSRMLPVVHWMALAICLVVMSVVPILNHFSYLAGTGKNKDYPMFFQTGQKVAQGQSPYPDDPTVSFDFMYPPSFSAMLALLSLPGMLGFVILLVGVCSLSWVVCIRWSLTLGPGAPPQDQSLCALVPTLLVVGYAWGIYLLGQPIIFLLACVLGALVCVRKNRPWSAGALVALAAGVKAFPILALGWFIFRRQWKAVLSCLLWLAVLLLVLPAIFRGPSGAIADLRTWTDGTFKYSDQGIAQRASRGGSWRNGSVFSVVKRLLMPVIAENEPQTPVDPNGPLITETLPGADGPPLYVNIAHASFRTVNIVIGVATVLICAVFLLSVPRTPRRTPQTDAVEYSMLLLMMIIFTPLSFTYLNFWTLFPMVLSLQFMINPRWPLRSRQVVLWGFLAFVVLTLLSIPMLPVFHILRAMGNTLAANILLLVLMAYQMRVMLADPLCVPVRRPDSAI